MATSGSFRDEDVDKDCLRILDMNLVLTSGTVPYQFEEHLRGLTVVCWMTDH